MYVATCMMIFDLANTCKILAICLQDLAGVLQDPKRFLQDSCNSCKKTDILLVMILQNGIPWVASCIANYTITI